MEGTGRPTERGADTLSEFESKRLLARYGIPVTREGVVESERDAAAKAAEIGYPVVLKGCGAAVSHKTELNLVFLNLSDESQVRRAFKDLAARRDLGVEGVLVQEMVRGGRELLAGLVRDEQLGPCVMFGLGGILAEVLEDVSFRVAPLSRWDAMDMMDEIRGRKILDAFRGEPPADREVLADVLRSLGQIGLDHDEVREIDINPLKLVGGKPVAVDALVVRR